MSKHDIFTFVFCSIVLGSLTIGGFLILLFDYLFQRFDKSFNDRLAKSLFVIYTIECISRRMRKDGCYDWIIKYYSKEMKLTTIISKNKSAAINKAYEQYKIS